MKAVIMPAETKEYAAKITLFGREYALILTTGALKEIGERYGGIDKLGEVLENVDVTRQLDDVIWLLMTLANQSVKIHNKLCHDDDVWALLTPEDFALVELFQLTEMVAPLSQAMGAGLKRKIGSEDDEKNAAPA
jgi:hypothetical protein